MGQEDDNRQPYCCCLFCCKLIFSIPLLFFSLWLSLLLAKPPVVSIEDFNVYALNSSAPNTTAKPNNHTIYFDLKLNNKENKDQGVYYDVLNLTFSYQPNRSIPVANVTFPGFYQGKQKKKHQNYTTELNRLNWTAATVAVSKNGSAVFRMDLKTKVKYKLWFLKSKWHKLEIGAALPVNNMGQMVRKEKKKGIKLKSGAQKCMDGCACYLPLLFVGLVLSVWVI